MILECFVLDPNTMEPIPEVCTTCRDYFETQQYFKTNQECAGKMVLVKNNAPITVENGQFKINAKVMCCAGHHSVQFFFFKAVLTNATTNRKIYEAKVPIFVKQWRKSNQKKSDIVLLFEPVHGQ